MTEEQFLEKQGKYFYLRTMKYIINCERIDNTGDIKKMIEANAVFKLDFPEGSFTIRWNELVDKANKDLEDFKNDFPDLEWEDNIQPLKIVK